MGPRTQSIKSPLSPMHHSTVRPILSYISVIILQNTVGRSKPLIPSNDYATHHAHSRLPTVLFTLANRLHNFKRWKHYTVQLVSFTVENNLCSMTYRWSSPSMRGLNSEKVQDSKSQNHRCSEFKLYYDQRVCVFGHDSQSQLLRLAERIREVIGHGKYCNLIANKVRTWPVAPICETK